MTLDYKETLELIGVHYEDARNDEFDAQLMDFIKNTRETNGVVTEDDLQGFIDSFTFPEEFEWCANEYNKYVGAYEDEKYEEQRDKEMEII